MSLTADYFITDELRLTEIRPEDMLSIVKHIDDKLIYQNTLHIPYPYYESDAEEFLRIVRKFEENYDHVGQYAIRVRGEMVGGIGFLYTHGEMSHRAEIGYWIGALHRGKGIMTLAIKKIAEIGFNEKGLFRLEANVFRDNEASMRVLEKAGFEKEGLRKSIFIKGDKLVDSFHYALVRGV